MAISGEQSTEIAARPEAVFAVASDLERYPEWQDFLQRVTVTERDADGRPTLVEAEADARVTALRLVLRATRSEPTRVGWHSEGGDLKAISGAFDLAPAGDGRTRPPPAGAGRPRATFALEVAPGRKLGLLLRGGVADRLRDRIMSGMLDGLRRQAERQG